MAKKESKKDETQTTTSETKKKKSKDGTKSRKKERQVVSEAPAAASSSTMIIEESKEEDEHLAYEKKVLCVAPIARPLASKELNRKLLRVIRKASKNKDIKRGVKEVVKVIRKQQHKKAPHGALVVFAGNISPIDVLTHVPVMCEDNDVPYIYVPAKEDLGEAAQTKRPTSCVMILAKKDADYIESLKKCLKEIKNLSAS
jgi:H/ACA ribonucleoprotein complex subunit 2